MVAEHTVKAFDEDMTRLRGLVAEMGGLAELSITEAMDALVGGDEDLAAALHDVGAGEDHGVHRGALLHLVRLASQAALVHLGEQHR